MALRSRENVSYSSPWVFALKANPSRVLTIEITAAENDQFLGKCGPKLCADVKQEPDDEDEL